MHGFLARLACGSIGILLLGANPVMGQDGAPTNGEWPTYGGDIGGTKYSPLDQIDRHNFADLEIAWSWRSADGFLSVDTGDDGEWWANSQVIFRS